MRACTRVCVCVCACVSPQAHTYPPLLLTIHCATVIVHHKGSVFMSDVVPVGTGLVLLQWGRDCGAVPPSIAHQLPFQDCTTSAADC